jgi:hypothetical protein
MSTSASLKDVLLPAKRPPVEARPNDGEILRR